MALTAGVPNLWELAGMSTTLANALLSYGGIAALCLGGIVALFWGRAQFGRRHRQAVARLHADQHGVVISVDLMLIAVPFILFVTLIVQMSWLMRETVIVHYAAYAAARSVKVHECPWVPDGIIGLMLVQRKLLCTGKEQEQALEAARYSLIAASPPWDIACEDTCEVPEEVLRTIAREGGTSQRENMLVRQAHYAYDPANVELKISMDERMTMMSGEFPWERGARPSVKAELVYRHHIVKWVGPLLGVERDDGDYYREGRAVVSLL